MKKLLFIAALLSVSFAANAQRVASTNVAAGTWVLLSTRAHVDTVQIMATNNTTVYFYDQNTVAAPYYGTNVVIPSYVSAASYATNIARSYVDYTGYTNWSTNTGVYTYYVTNSAATNVLGIVGAVSATANQAVDLPVDWLFSRGIVIRSPTYGVSVNMTYQP